MIIGTAGHVDHGKTALVRALTGVETDRLKEEKARGITIDLGFAYVPAGDGRTIGFVDVPGHETLVRTMVAGAAGIDFALIVVAGDDGVMPQTLEHLDILGLLGLTRGLIAVSKSDRLDEARRRDVAREISQAVDKTPFARSELLFVSALTGEGIEDLRSRLVTIALAMPPRASDGGFRLSIDRSFSLKGVGTVVTGTALGGRIAVDDEVTILPSRRRVRVRSLHAQNNEAEAGHAGERCALALVGVAKDVVGRGDWICADAMAYDSKRFDVELHVLPSAGRPIGPWSPVHFHCGASDVAARVVVLSSERLSPGTIGYAQVVLDRPLPVRQGDLFVLRDQSARRTIGGGKVVDPRAPLRKRRTPERMERLAALSIDDPQTSLARLLDQPPHCEDIGVFVEDRGLARRRATSLCETLDLEALRFAEATFVLKRPRLRDFARAATNCLAQSHADNPEAPGLGSERLRLMMNPVLPKPVFAALRARLLADGEIALRGPYLHRPDHVPQISAETRRVADLVRPLIAKDRFRPPRVRDLGKAVSIPEIEVRRTCKGLARIGEFIEIATDHFFLYGTVLEMAGIAEDLSRSSENGYFAAAGFRDKLDSGRKVAIQILDFFDRRGLTRRDGDFRKVVKDARLVLGSEDGSDTDAREPAAAATQDRRSFES